MHAGFCKIGAGAGVLEMSLLLFVLVVSPTTPESASRAEPFKCSMQPHHVCMGCYIVSTIIAVLY
jgi:hypothetical protein